MPASFNPFSANHPNTLKLFVGILPTNCLKVFDHFVGFALKGLTLQQFTFWIRSYISFIEFFFWYSQHSSIDGWVPGLEQLQQ